MGSRRSTRAAGVRPVGYRAPSAEVSSSTVDVLLEHGIRYDASFSGADFTPYYLRRGDSWSGYGPYVFGETVDLVGIPFYRGLSDFTYFEFVGGATYQQSPASAVYEIWHEELEYAYANAAGGVYDLALHPQVIGRGHRMLMLERLIEAIREKDGHRLRPARRVLRTAGGRRIRSENGSRASRSRRGVTDADGLSGPRTG